VFASSPPHGQTPAPASAAALTPLSLSALRTRSVNNAGIQHVAPVEDFPEDKWTAVIDVILNSTFHASKAALPMMLQRRWGRVVNTGSMHALVASPYKSAYNAAKHGVAGAPAAGGWRLGGG
jgi:NAD(P)-dependent dehydrogenase (short-subunit alcohol dehydrogenase family)